MNYKEIDCLYCKKCNNDFCYKCNNKKKLIMLIKKEKIKFLQLQNKQCTDCSGKKIIKGITCVKCCGTGSLLKFIEEQSCPYCKTKTKKIVYKINIYSYSLLNIEKNETCPICKGEKFINLTNKQFKGKFEEY
ncbi:hypothetical protein [Arcobacter roscoffensis]|uniref:RING-type domain-containing protein n=1 Tax=Arcobacter roscoffensis TaxID=2961520 RepID=A0ABY5E2Y8_9BACT|nr:hypothetical protein [Arcobacter roscoffensis]UTJ05892.1 hypothetical protein NJU99_11620 [Arcobacter roscoffensis]